MTFAHCQSPGRDSPGSALLWLFAADTNGCVHALEVSTGALDTACRSLKGTALSPQALGACVRNCGPVMLPNLRGAHALTAQAASGDAGQPKLPRGPDPLCARLGKHGQIELQRPCSAVLSNWTCGRGCTGLLLRQA